MTMQLDYHVSNVPFKESEDQLPSRTSATVARGEPILDENTGVVVQRVDIGWILAAAAKVKRC